MKKKYFDPKRKCAKQKHFDPEKKIKYAKQHH